MWKPQRVQWLAKPFVFFSLFMILKIYLAKIVIFPEGSGWIPLMTDLAAVWSVFCLIEWLAPKRKLGAYLIADLIMTCIYFAVIMYYKYFGVIVTYHALQQAGQVTEVQGSVMSLLHPYFLLIYVDIVVLFILIGVSRRFRQWGKGLSVREPWRVVVSVLVLSLVTCLANVWHNRNDMNELVKAESMGIIPYEMLTVKLGVREAIAGSTAVSTADITPEAIAGLKGLTSVGTPQHFGQAKGKNLIVIQMEALQNFLLGTKIDGIEVTPNLNALLAETLYFPRFYQMVGQGNTADAEFVVNTSFYIPPHGAASQEFGDVRLPGMPRTLSANGYATATFHTNDVKFWNRKALYRALGFDKYYDKEYFGHEDQVFFGASDEVLYAKTTDKLLEMSRAGKPFYAQIISMSGHHPFNIPERKIKFNLPERYQGTLVGDYLQSQNYADYALGEFIRTLKQNGLWDSSVVVIYGDHMGVPIFSLGEEERGLMKAILKKDYRYTEMLNIPLILSVPGMEGPQVIEETGGQADIFPTVANLLGIPLGDHIVFGQDLLNHKANILPQRYYLPSGSLVNDRGIFVPGEGFSDGEMIAFGGANASPSDVTEEQYEKALELLRMSDRYVRSLPGLD